MASIIVAQFAIMHGPVNFVFHGFDNDTMEKTIVYWGCSRCSVWGCFGCSEWGCSRSFSGGVLEEKKYPHLSPHVSLQSNSKNPLQKHTKFDFI